MNRKTTKKVDESTLTTLCAVCRGAFLDAKGVRLRRADPRQLVKDVCTYCQTRYGFDYYADMEPHIGSEQGGKRPVVVLQNNIGNRHSPTLIVATVTTRTEKKKNQPTHVLVDSNPAFEEPSMILLEQIFTIDKSRMQVMRSCGPHPSFSHSAFNAAAVSASMPSFRRRAGCQRVELSLCALARGVGACRLHSDGRSCRCGRNCLRRLLYGARLWPRCRNVITRYNTFASVICKVQWTLRSLSEGTSPAGKLRLKNWINCK